MAPLLNELPNDLSISGHTDSLAYLNGYRGYSNWELSSDRANASRRELVAGGLEPSKLLRISGFADRVPMPDTEASDPINRRIELLVLFRQVADRIRSPGVIHGAGSPSPISRQPVPRVDAAPVERFTKSLKQALGTEQTGP
jgi:chemotaxis protein MotB